MSDKIYFNLFNDGSHLNESYMSCIDKPIILTSASPELLKSTAPASTENSIYFPFKGKPYECKIESLLSYQDLSQYKGIAEIVGKVTKRKYQTDMRQYEWVTESLLHPWQLNDFLQSTKIHKVNLPPDRRILQKVVKPLIDDEHIVIIGSVYKSTLNILEKFNQRGWPFRSK